MDTGKIEWEYTGLGSIENYAITEDGMVYINSRNIAGQNIIYALNPKPTESQTDETSVFLGMAQAKRLLGRYTDAITDLQNMLSSSADFPDAYSELALCYENMGNINEATKTWDKYLMLSIKPGEIIPKDLSRHLWELIGLRWYGPRVGGPPGDQIITADDTIYISASPYISARDEYIYALNSETGKLKWQFRGGKLGIAKSGDRILAHSNGIIHALDAHTGQVQWDAQLEDEVFSVYIGAPVTRDEVVYVPSTVFNIGVRLYALSVQTGEILWKFDMSRPEKNDTGAKRINFQISYLVVQDKVYWSPDRRYLYAISKEEGELKWQFDCGEISQEPSYYGKASPVVIEEMAYIIVADALAAISKDTGESVWKMKIPNLTPFSLITVGDRFIYVVPSDYKAIYALALDTGEIKWQSSEIGAISKLIVGDGILYAHHDEGRSSYNGRSISVFTADTGEKKWTLHSLYGVQILDPVIALTNKEIYVLGSLPATETIVILYVFSSETGEFKWMSNLSVGLFRRISNYLLTIAHGSVYISTNAGFYAFDLAKIELLGKQWWDSMAPKPVVSSANTIIGKDDALMVLIPAGEFEMGDHFSEGYNSDLPVHAVYLDAFYMDIHEVTNAQYQKFIDATGHRAPGWWNAFGHNAPNQPVVGISWHDAAAYAEWARKQLPTEAQWEKAARGGLVGKRYPWGDEISHDDANYSGTGGKNEVQIKENASPVGSFAPNGYGLYDMAGNVLEWCADWYNESYYSNSPYNNPLGPDSGSSRVLRGGSWANSPSNLRVALRNYRNPTKAPINVGFRCVSQD